MTFVQQSNGTSSFVLATDLDGTFAGGTSSERRELQRALVDEGAMLVYVTGRSVPSARSLMDELDLPRPRVLIADVGTSVVDGRDLTPLESLEASIASRWPGADPVRERLDGLPGLTEQEIEAPHRVSFLARDGELAEVLERVRRRVADLEVELIASDDVYIDIAPGGVDKGRTTLRLREHLGSSPDRWVVAGDTMNDLSLFTTGLPGIVVGNAEAELRRRVAGRAGIYLADAHGAAGVLEGLTRLGLVGARARADAE